VSQCGSKNRPGCGAEIIWGTLPDGSLVPLDLTAAVYQVFPWDPGSKSYPIVRVPGCKAGHRGICPIDRNFTRSNKAKPKDTSRPVGEPGRANGRDRAAGD
jgi:hypothetical protein